MPLPVVLAASYFVINLAITIWLVREETHGRVPPRAVAMLSSALRYGPPFIGLLYLVTMAGDWPFFLFVTAFFLGAFWLLDGLLSYPTRPPRR